MPGMATNRADVISIGVPGLDDVLCGGLRSIGDDDSKIFILRH